MSNPETDNLPPPPYTEVADVSDSANQPVRASLRGGYIRPSLPSEMPSDEINPSSAITYFEDRDEPELDHSGMSLSSIEYTIKFDDRTTRNDLTFPHPIEAYIARDVNSLDWSTFVNFLFLTHDGVRDEKYGNEKGLQRHSFAEQDTPARRDRILAVIAEWNANFFNPRRIQINADFSSLASNLTSRSAATVQDPYVRSLPFQPAQPTMYRDPLAQRSPPQPSRRSFSTSSSNSSSSLSVDSISSKDFEGADLNQVRSALLAFQLDVTKKDHLRASVRQLRDDLRSRHHDLSGNSKELKKEYKNQRKEIKKEVRAIVKEVKATRKAERKIRKAERKSRRKGKRAEYPGNDRTEDFQDKGRRAEERATEQVRRAQERGQEAERRASEKAARVHKIAALAMGQGSMAVARAQGRVADAKARGSKGEAERAREARTRADTAERRARDTAGRTRYEIDGDQENGVLLREG